MLFSQLFSRHASPAEPGELQSGLALRHSCGTLLFSPLRSEMCEERISADRFDPDLRTNTGQQFGPRLHKGFGTFTLEIGSELVVINSDLGELG